MDDRLVDAAFGCYRPRALEPGIVEKTFLVDFKHIQRKSNHYFKKLILVYKSSPLQIEYKYVDFLGSTDPVYSIAAMGEPIFLRFLDRNRSPADKGYIDLDINDYGESWLIIKER